MKVQPNASKLLQSFQRFNSLTSGTPNMDGLSQSTLVTVLSLKYVSAMITVTFRGRLEAALFTGVIIKNSTS